MLIQSSLCKLSFTIQLFCAGVMDCNPANAFSAANATLIPAEAMTDLDNRSKLPLLAYNLGNALPFWLIQFSDAPVCVRVCERETLLFSLPSFFKGST